MSQLIRKFDFIIVTDLFNKECRFLFHWLFNYFELLLLSWIGIDFLINKKENTWLRIAIDNFRNEIPNHFDEGLLKFVSQIVYPLSYLTNTDPGALYTLQLSKISWISSSTFSTVIYLLSRSFLLIVFKSMGFDTYFG